MTRVGEINTFRPCIRPFDRFRAHAPLQFLQKPAPSHPQIIQRKQRLQIGRVLSQSPGISL